MGARLQQVGCGNALLRNFDNLEETQSHYCFARLGHTVVLLSMYGNRGMVVWKVFGAVKQGAVSALPLLFIFVADSTTLTHWGPLCNW